MTLLKALPILSLMGGASVSAAELPIDLELYADLRLTHSTGEPTWFNDWLGKARYGGKWGEEQTKVRIPELSLIAKYDINWDLQFFAHAKYDPEQDKPLDLVEAYIKFSPVPKSSWSYQMKAGIFFPHISRENVGVAWTTPFSITPSAINSWVGEEIRAVGLEAQAKYKKDNHQLALTAAAFGYNDPAGTLLAFRGWALGDYKVGAFSRLPLPELPSIGSTASFLPNQPFWVKPVQEVDGKISYYGSVDYSYARKYKVGAFYYDNRGDPEALKHQQYGWDTRFWNFYLEADLPNNFKFISQYMTGNTLMGGLYGMYEQRYVDVDFESYFFLLSKRMKDIGLTVRYDWFATYDNSFENYDNNNEEGDAFTVAGSWKLGKKTTLVAEYLHIDSWRPSRSTIGFDPDQKNDVLQLSLRQRF